METDDSANYITWLIIGGIVLLIIAGFIMFLNGVFKVAVDDNTCWTSIEQHTRLLKSSESELEPDINCPTRFDVIPKNMEEVDVNQKIAEYWQQCWKEWHKGEAELFRNEGVYCHVCHIVQFEDRPELYGLYAYLSNRQVSNSDPMAERQTYLEYLTPFQTTETNNILISPTVLDASSTQQPVLDKIELETENYGIIILYAKGQDTIQKFMNGNRAELLYGGGGMLIGGTAIAGLGGLAATLPFVALTGPVGWVIIGGVAVAAVGAAVVTTVFEAGTDPPQWMAMSVFRPYDETVLQDLGCTIAPVKQ